MGFGSLGAGRRFGALGALGGVNAAAFAGGIAAPAGWQWAFISENGQNLIENGQPLVELKKAGT